MLVRFGIPRLLALSALCLTAGCNSRNAPYQPAEALKLFQLPRGFRIELVAAEPDVVDPVVRMQRSFR
jgi:hypothetical protein